MHKQIKVKLFIEIAFSPLCVWCVPMLNKIAWSYLEENFKSVKNKLKVLINEVRDSC